MASSVFLNASIGTAFAGQQVGPAADNTAAPPFSFLGDLNTGYASSAADTLDLVTGGTSRLKVSTAAVTSTLPILAPSGTNTAPSYTFASDASLDTGMYYPLTNVIGFSSGAQASMTVSASAVALQSGMNFGWSSGDPTAAGLDITLSRLGAGAWASNGPNGSATNFRKATTALTTNSGISTATATNLIPAGSLVVGVEIRITTVVAGAGMASFSIGDGSDADRWGAAIALAAGTTTTLANATINTAPIYAAATSVVLTANAGQFDSGVVRITVHYFSITAATS